MVKHYQILADDLHGNVFLCFVWRGNPSNGILRAKKDSIFHNRQDLSNFRAKLLKSSNHMGNRLDVFA